MSRRRGPSTRVCIFADACDLLAARQLLLELPDDAYGQLYISADHEPIVLPAPSRVQVSWLGHRVGACALAEAMAGWAAEWLPDGTDPEQQGPVVWVLPGAAAALAASGHECVTRLITVLPSSQLIQG